MTTKSPQSSCGGDRLDAKITPPKDGDTVAAFVKQLYASLPEPVERLRTALRRYFQPLHPA